MRLDYLQRPELTKGTVDFAVPKEYWAVNPPQGLNLPYSTIEPRATGPRQPQPLKYIFALDISREAIDSGLLSAACNSIRTLLYGKSYEDGTVVEPDFPVDATVAIITFDNSIHFYNLSVGNVLQN
jgi:protein transport protein SEC24